MCAKANKESENGDSCPHKQDSCMRSQPATIT